MKADTFAKLIILETLIDAEIGNLLERPPAEPVRFREGMVARISDLVDEVDALDAVAAARVYDAIVDFLAELPDVPDDEAAVDAALRFKRAVDRLVARGMQDRQIQQASTWATVLDELLDELADEYHASFGPDGEPLPRETGRSRALLARARASAERLLDAADRADSERLRDGMDRLSFAVAYRRLRPAEVDLLIRDPQRIARRHRPSTLTRVGTYVLGQLLRRASAGREGG